MKSTTRDSLVVILLGVIAATSVYGAIQVPGPDTSTIRKQITEALQSCTFEIGGLVFGVGYSTSFGERQPSSLSQGVLVGDYRVPPFEYRDETATIKVECNPYFSEDYP